MGSVAGATWFSHASCSASFRLPSCQTTLQNCPYVHIWPLAFRLWLIDKPRPLICVHACDGEGGGREANVVHTCTQKPSCLLSKYLAEGSLISTLCWHFPLFSLSWGVTIIPFLSVSCFSCLCGVILLEKGLHLQNVPFPTRVCVCVCDRLVIHLLDCSSGKWCFYRPHPSLTAVSFASCFAFWV